MDIIELKPRLVFEYFTQLNKVPRPSKKEGKVIAFLQNFAKEHNLPCKTDKAGNILITKSATPGMENKPTVVLQSHMDMVCEKTSSREIDFDNDPIETYIEGDWMHAKGTTLGADDGIGVAIEMALLTDETIEHGPIECLFTVDEETGLTGAFELQPGFFTGKYLLNLDSEEEGFIYIGCAGGAKTEITLELQKETLRKSFFPLHISVDHLRGGHSGGDIHDHRANALKVLTRFIYLEMQKYDVRLIDLKGGNKHNAIPRQAEAIIAVPFDKKEDVRIDFNIFASDFEGEFPKEKNIEFFLESCTDITECVTPSQAEQIINALTAVFNGVYEMSTDIPNLVETSSNLASVRIEDNIMHIVTSQRSSIGSQRIAVSNTVAATFKLIGANVEIGDGYPGWKPNLKSKLLKIACNTYHNLFDKEPSVLAIHAGLECGLFSEKYPGLEMISFGPSLRDVHTPDEALCIPTVEMVWKHILSILKEID